MGVQERQGRTVSIRVLPYPEHGFDSRHLHQLNKEVPMLRVTVEFVGQHGPRETLGALHIVNDGTGMAPGWGNYQVIQFPSALTPGKHVCDVRGFPREDLGPWYLVKRALEAMLPDAS